MVYFKNGVEYERDVKHCNPTTYVKKVTIKSVEPAYNSDRLDRIEFEEIGWQTIYQRGVLNKGDVVLFIPAESVLPLKLSEILGIRKYLSTGRVRITRLRGNRSEGIIDDYEKVKPWISNILQWEDLPSIEMQGQLESRKNIPINFHEFYKMPNILNEPSTFKLNEDVYYSEKLHGTNMRCGRLIHPETGEYVVYVGGHITVFKESETNIYWKSVKKYLEDKLPKDIEFFGEIYGKGIQKLHYDQLLPKVRIFAASENREYMDIKRLINICKDLDMPIVDFHETKFKSVEQIRSLADEPSEYTKSHVREGVVIVSKDNPRRMAKSIGFKYMTSKRRTERH